MSLPISLMLLRTAMKLKGRCLRLRGRYLRLRDRYLRLRGRHLKLKGRYLRLKGRYLRLRGRYLKLRGRYLRLRGRYLRLRGRYLKLRGRYLRLRGRYLRLKGRYLKLRGRYLRLKGRYLKLRGRHLRFFNLGALLGTSSIEVWAVTVRERVAVDFPRALSMAESPSWQTFGPFWNPKKFAQMLKCLPGASFTFFQLLIVTLPYRPKSNFCYNSRNRSLKTAYSQASSPRGSNWRVSLLGIETNPDAPALHAPIETFQLESFPFRD